MKKSFCLWSLLGFGFSSLSGTLLHFAYDTLGGVAWIAPFSSVNESTFEHMKLLFMPMFVYTLIQSFFFREIKSFWCIKLYSTLIGLIIIPTAFYTYNGVIGRSPAFINIAIFFIALAFSYLYEFFAFKKESVKCKYPGLAFILLFLIFLSFAVFTFATPKINLFKDPITNTYGI